MTCAVRLIYSSQLATVKPKLKQPPGSLQKHTISLNVSTGKSYFLVTTYQLLAGPAQPHLVLGIELVAVLLEVLLDLLQLILAQQGGGPGPPAQL